MDDRSSIPNSPASVEVVDSLPLDAVLRRKFEMAEQAGQVLDLTHAESTTAAAGSTSQSLQTIREVIIIDPPSESAVPVDEGLAFGSPPAAAAAGREITQSPTPQQTPMARAAMTTTTPGSNSQWYCQLCPTRVRDPWMKLCSDCYRQAKQSEVERQTAATPPSLSTFTQNQQITHESLHPGPQTVQGSPSIPIGTTGTPALPRTGTQFHSSPLIPSFIDDREMNASISPDRTATDPSQGMCRSCHTRLRHSWMTLCAQCHPTQATETVQSVCLACHCSLRDAWMTWCWRCYERGLVDAEHFRKDQASKNTDD